MLDVLKMKRTQIKEFLSIAPLVLLTCIHMASCIVPDCVQQNLKAASSYKEFSFYDISRSQTESRCYKWNISTKHGTGSVYLYLSSFRGTFDVSCTSSFVGIYYGNDTTRNPDVVLCGYESRKYYTSNSSSMTVVASPQFSGYFSFEYKSVGDDECTIQHLTAQMTDKYLKSTDLSKYTDDCYEWRITSTDVSSQISLYLSSLYLRSSEPCNQSSISYVAIFDGSDATFPRKAMLCGPQQSNTYLSSNASMTVFFRTSGSFLDSFTFLYSTVPSTNLNTDSLAACKVVYLTADFFYQYISSNTSSSRTGSVCYEWHISAHIPQQVFLRVSRFYVAEQRSCTTSATSYVAIYDGSSTTSSKIDVLCGYHYTGTYSSSSFKLTVVYRSSDQSRDDFSLSYNSAEVSTKRNTYNSNTEAYTSPALNKTSIIWSTVGSMVGLISTAVGLGFVHNRRKNQRLARASTTASMSSNVALNRDPSNSSLPTFSSPATFNDWRPSYWRLGDQDVAQTTSSNSKLQPEGVPPLSTASPVTTSVSWDTCTATPPPPYPAHTVNLYSELDTDRPAGAVETPTHAAYTNIVAIDENEA